MYCGFLSFDSWFVWTAFNYQPVSNNDRNFIVIQQGPTQNFDLTQPAKSYINNRIQDQFQYKLMPAPIPAKQQKRPTRNWQTQKVHEQFFTPEKNQHNKRIWNPKNQHSQFWDVNYYSELTSIRNIKVNKPLVDVANLTITLHTCAKFVESIEYKCGLSNR